MEYDIISKMIRPKASIQATRLLESLMKLWELAPHMELLKDRLPNEDIYAAEPWAKNIRAVYFTEFRIVWLRES